MNNYSVPDFFTDEQKEAVLKKGKNIIVSAGAGSGKTAVLKERVLRILLNDYFNDKKVSISNLIILTFTKNAAREMKERIRKILIKYNLTEEIEKLDSAYITTFDSYASSLVKKYSYLLNMSADFTIIDTSIINIEINKILDDILEEYYKCNEDKFHHLIESFSVKNDLEIRKYIIKLYKYINTLIDKDNYLDNYIETHYNIDYVNNLFDEYTDIVLNIKEDIVLLLDELDSETINEDKRISNNNITSNFIGSISYDELIDSINFTLEKSLKDVYTDTGKEIKDNISVLLKKLKTYVTIPKKDLISNYLSTKNDVEVLINITRELDKRISKFKSIHNAYDYIDISLKAIELVKNYSEVRDDIKNNTYEIMIDEYQDTSDIQESFISYIENNNVYMVGDIKQSIYRFRNANPYIFMNKYNLYKNSDIGYKIDLTKNFRSREEVINDINKMFSNIMSIDIGGANYKEEHIMKYGNKDYELKNNQDYSTSIINYDMDKYKKEYTTSEIESFIIANDIKNKIDNKIKVLDNKVLRDITYKDFCILVDKSKNFELVKKILESFNIPVSIDKDISIKEEDEIFILKNIINLIISIKDNKIDSNFKHYFMSVGRSYIIRMTDNEIFNCIINNTYKDTLLYKKCLEISKQIDSISNSEILLKIIEDFDIINTIPLVGDTTERLTKLEYFINNAKSLNAFGMDIYDMSDYFDEILNGDEDIKMHTSFIESNSVKIMTIHASKGLEFSYVYLPFLNSDFTKSGSGNSRFIIDNKYGIITPFYNEGVGNTFVNLLHTNYEYKEELSEKIRLLYVAITRSKEKVIFINSFNDKLIDIKDSKTYNNILNIIKDKFNITDINLDEMHINKLYNVVVYNYMEHIKPTKDIITTNNIVINSNIEESTHFSKSLTHLVDRTLHDNLDFGTYMHYVFEVYNFNSPNIDELNIDNNAKEKIINFLKHNEVKNISSAKIYKEYEIRFELDNKIYHGFIDLLVEYSDHFDIIDYKLSNIDSEEYVTQLTGYKNYIENQFNKETNIYLYSINKDIFKKLN